MTGKAVLIEVPVIREMCNAVQLEAEKRGLGVARHAGIAAFKDAKDPLAPGDVLFTLGLPCTRELLASTRPRAVVSPYIGTDFIDMAAATELGVVVGHGQVPENTIGMAEATIMLMLACLYDLHRAEEYLRKNQPRPPRFARLARGKTVGIVGLGTIGRAIAQRLVGWELKVLGHSPRPRPPYPGDLELVALDELLSRSDVVMISANLTAETRDLIDARRIALMKKDAVLINTSRGGIVNEAALLEAMRSGHLAYTALDVFETEPLPPDNPLRELPNALLTQHMVGQTVEAEHTLLAAAVENVVRPLEGRPPLYVRNPAVLPVWEKRWA